MNRTLVSKTGERRHATEGHSCDCCKSTHPVYYLEFLWVHFFNHLFLPHSVHSFGSNVAFARELVALAAEKVAEYVAWLLRLVVRRCLGWFEVGSAEEIKGFRNS